MPKDPHLRTISVNLPADLVKRIQRLGLNQDLSASSIVEHALIVFLDDYSETELADRLRDLGAKLRRT